MLYAVYRQDVCKKDGKTALGKTPPHPPPVTKYYIWNMPNLHPLPLLLSPIAGFFYSYMAHSFTHMTLG